MSNKLLAFFKSICWILGIIAVNHLLALGYDFWRGNNDGYIADWNINRVFGIAYFLVVTFSIFIGVFISTDGILKTITANALLLVWLLLFLEISSFVAIKMGIVAIKDKPTYAFFRHQKPFKFIIPNPLPKYAFADTSKYWGVWHYEKVYKQQGNCYQTIDTINSQGARDRQRDKKSSKKRFVVLGDSFVEGFGVSREDRLSDTLERTTALEHLNFGTSGGFGPTQYYLLYKHLVKTFDHDAVIVAILPANDFSNDDSNYLKSEVRYRPYWIGKYPDYTLVYNLKKPEDSDWYPTNIWKVMRGNEAEKYRTFNEMTMRNYSWLWLILEKVSQSISTLKPQNITSKYENFTDEEWGRLRFSLEKIREEAPNKKIILLTFPIIDDLKVRKEIGKKLRLTETIEAFSEKHKSNVLYVDMLEYFYKNSTNWPSIFLPCDGHWSATGQKLAAQGLLENKEYQKLVASFKQ